MSATIQSIIDRVTYITKDHDRVRWTLKELCQWINDAQDQIAQLHPRVASDYVNLTLAEGSRQDLREIDPDRRWIRLHELVCNVNTVTVEGQPVEKPTGATIRQISRPSLDFAFKSWRGKAPTSAVVEEYALDERNPYVFDVVPPVAAGVKVLALAAAKPAPVAALDAQGTALLNPGELFGLPDGYDIPAVEYVCFRCFSKDSNDPSYASRATTSLQLFNLAMGVETTDAGGTQ